MKTNASSKNIIAVLIIISVMIIGAFIFFRFNNNTPERYNQLGVKAADDNLAFKYFEKAAEQGYAPAIYNLAIYYKFGKGVSQNCDKAFELYSKAAEQGVASAQYKLALHYENGSGVKKDIVKAFEWYSKAAKHGHAKAQYVLAIFYDNGEVVNEDHVIAV